MGCSPLTVDPSAQPKSLDALGPVGIAWQGSPERLGPCYRRAVVEGVVGCERCLFDFVRMMLVEFGSGRRRSVSWIDVGGNCFFPKSFVSDDTFEDVRIRIQVRLEAESKLGKRKRALHVELDHAEVVQYSNGNRSSTDRGGGEGRRGNVLVKRAPAEGIARWPNCRLMRGEERGFRIVKSIFLEKARTVDPGVSVKSVCYFVRTSYTSRARCGRIMAHGFGVPSDVEKSHGVGVHLSPIGLPQLSVMKFEPDENGEKHVILCRVLLGKVEKVEKVDAGSKQYRPASTNYDNGVDDLKNPKHFIVWCTNMNTHILPQCVVSFKSSRNV
ncbi:hypothetical protein QQ045_001547 [Rhodiola kirilowii]